MYSDVHKWQAKQNVVTFFENLYCMCWQQSIVWVGEGSGGKAGTPSFLHTRPLPSLGNTVNTIGFQKKSLDFVWPVIYGHHCTVHWQEVPLPDPKITLIPSLIRGFAIKRTPFDRPANDFNSSVGIEKRVKSSPPSRLFRSSFVSRRVACLFLQEEEKRPEGEKQMAFRHCHSSFFFRILCRAVIRIGFSGVSLLCVDGDNLRLRKSSRHLTRFLILIFTKRITTLAVPIGPISLYVSCRRSVDSGGRVTFDTRNRRDRPLTTSRWKQILLVVVILSYTRKCDGITRVANYTTACFSVNYKGIMCCPARMFQRSNSIHINRLYSRLIWYLIPSQQT